MLPTPPGDLVVVVLWAFGGVLWRSPYGGFALGEAFSDQFGLCLTSFCSGFLFLLESVGSVVFRVQSVIRLCLPHSFAILGRP